MKKVLYKILLIVAVYHFAILTYIRVTWSISNPQLREFRGLASSLVIIGGAILAVFYALALLKNKKLLPIAIAGVVSLVLNVLRVVSILDILKDALPALDESLVYGAYSDVIFWIFDSSMLILISALIITTLTIQIIDYVKAKKPTSAAQ